MAVAVVVGPSSSSSSTSPSVFSLASSYAVSNPLASFILLLVPCGFPCPNLGSWKNSISCVFELCCCYSSLPQGALAASISNLRRTAPAGADAASPPGGAVITADGATTTTSSASAPSDEHPCNTTVTATVATAIPLDTPGSNSQVCMCVRFMCRRCVCVV